MAFTAQIRWVAMSALVCTDTMLAKLVALTSTSVPMWKSARSLLSVETQPEITPVNVILVLEEIFAQMSTSALWPVVATKMLHA